MVSGAPTLRHPDGQDVVGPGDIVCFPEGEAGAHEFLNHAAEPARVLTCSAPVNGPRPRSTPTTTRMCSVSPGGWGTAFAFATSSRDHWDGEPEAGSA